MNQSREALILDQKAILARVVEEEERDNIRD
jgi:hypothetical protein